MINIMEEYGTIKILKFQNNICRNNNKALICFETKEEAQRAIADIIRPVRYVYEINEAMVCYTTQKEAGEAISQINKGTEWHAEISKRETNEGRNKKTMKIRAMKKVKEIKQTMKDKIIKVEKGQINSKKKQIS